MSKNITLGARFVYFVLPSILFAAAIFYMSSLEYVDVPVSFKFSDKVIHMLLYCFLGWLLIRALHFGRTDPISKKLMIISFLIGAFYGFSDEIHQYFVPGRNSEFLDWLADSVGVLIGTEIYRRLHRYEMQFVHFATKSLN